MGFFIKKVIQKTLEKGFRIHPHDIMMQTNVDDVIQILKEILT